MRMNASRRQFDIIYGPILLYLPPSLIGLLKKLLTRWKMINMIKILVMMNFLMMMTESRENDIPVNQLPRI